MSLYSEGIEDAPKKVEKQIEGVVTRPLGVLERVERANGSFERYMPWLIGAGAIAAGGIWAASFLKKETPASQE